MFKTELAREIWTSKYRYNNETPKETFFRVAQALASVEKKPEDWVDKFFNTLVRTIENEPVGLKCTTGGRITANVGTIFEKATLLNCFVAAPISNAKVSYKRETDNGLIKFPIEYETDDTPDDLINIFLTIVEQAKTLASEGGYGLSFDFIRPRSSIIKGTGIKHPGVVAYMKIWDAVSQCIVQGDADGYVDKIKNYLGDDKFQEAKTVIKNAIRKGAMLAALSVTHPDCEEFVRAKQTSGELTKFNISVVLTDDFLKAVENDDFFEQSFNGKVFKRIKARELYDLIMLSCYDRAEPGVLFADNMMRNNPIAYLGRVTATNPCIIGSSIIATADGRNGVSIKQLAQEGKDLPVYSRNKLTDKVEIKMGRNPRITGEQREVWKLTLDDDSVFIATPDHKIPTRYKGDVELKNLKPGESLLPFNSHESNGYRQISYTSNKKRSNGLRLSRRQYRLIFEFFNPDIEITKDDRIHHSNFNSLDDRPEFLVKCTKQEHQSFHDISGKNNPMYRLRDKQKYRENMSKATSGLKNGRAYEITSKELLSHFVGFTRSIGRKPKRQELFGFCKSNNLPYPQKFRQKEFNCSNYTEFSNLLETEAFFNHKVKKVEFHGYEDVYNITVDDNHNYIVLTSWNDDKFLRSSGICVNNCGEVPGIASIGTVCLLGSLNLTQYVRIKTDGTTYFDFDEYIEDIRIFTRMLDNVNDLTYAPLPSYQWVIDNLRQIGMGINGLGSALMMLRIPYNSKEAVEFAKKICQLKENLTWQTSALLAKEKGVFGAYIKEQFEATEFFNSSRITDETRELLKKYGARNAKTTTVPPLGNSSILSDVTSNGIEPVYLIEYERKVVCQTWPEDLSQDNVKQILKHYKEKDYEYWRGRFGDYEYYYEPHNRGLCKINIVRDYGYQWLLDNFPEQDHSKYLITTKDLNIDDHLAIQAVVQFYNNQSTSKTANLPNEYPFEDFKQLYLKAWKLGLNGFTTYREGSMESVLSDIGKAEKREIIAKDIKLPDVFINGDTHIIKREGKKFYLHFSYLPDDSRKEFPICIWIYTNSQYGGEELKVCNKASRNLAKLALSCGISDEIVKETVGKANIDYPHNRLGRMISLCLRHNIPREDILVSLMGIDGDNISTLLTAVRKFLSQTLSDGIELKGLKCPQCGGRVVMQAGCFKCIDCADYSGCG